MHGRGNGRGRTPRLHELQHSRLPQHVLQNHPVGAQLHVGLAPNKVGRVGVVEVGQQDLVRQANGPIEVGPDRIQVAVHLLICV